MIDNLQKAIHNNVGLYKAIFNNHQIKSNQTSSIWYCLEETPPLYSNLISLSKDWLPDENFYEIDLNYEKENWAEWSIKDSFGVLDLRKYGFAKLFDAQWLHLESKNFVSSGVNKNLRYKILDNEDELSKWRFAWDSNERLGRLIFSSELLNNSEVYFVAGYDGEQILSGCLVNKTNDVLGVSNFFAPDESIVYRSGIIEFILSLIEDTNIVGYERNAASGILALGFETIGNLTVWLKRRK